MRLVKFFKTLCVFVIVFSIVISAKTIAGDVNNDSKVDIGDCLAILKNISHDIEDTSADANGDGIVNVRDAVAILKYVAGEEVSLIFNDGDAKNAQRLADWTYTLDDESGVIKLTKYIGENPNIHVPSAFVVNGKEYKTMVITDRSTQSSAFSGSQIIRSVFFEDGVMANEMSYMFKGCPNLRYVNQYPKYDGVWWVGVFVNCKKLASAPQIPNDIENIRITSFFSKCENLIGEYPMPESYNPNYVNNVFLNCDGINKATNVIWFGDSITAGTSTKGVSFVNYLREELKDTAIANVAIGGRTLSYGYEVMDSQIETSIVYDLESFGVLENIDYVFVSAGTNDFAHRSFRRPYGTYRFADIGDVSDSSAHTLLGAINNIRKEVGKKFPNAKLVFTTPITRYNYDVEGAKATDASVFTIHLKDFVDAIKLGCEAAKIPYFDAYLESGMDVLSDSCDGNGDYFADKTHPTLNGQRKLADYFLEKLVSEYGFQKSE